MSLEKILELVEDNGLRLMTMNDPDLKRIADALERIALILESNVHINIDHGHIDDIAHGDFITHPKSY
tara:strand:- start:1170 stop:1373 length:204 start_codon:yes stop_codon:yes gene_type:complete